MDFHDGIFLKDKNYLINAEVFKSWVSQSKSWGEKKRSQLNKRRNLEGLPLRPLASLTFNSTWFPASQITGTIITVRLAGTGLAGRRTILASARFLLHVTANTGSPQRVSRAWHHEWQNRHLPVSLGITPAPAGKDAAATCPAREVAMQCDNTSLAGVSHGLMRALSVGSAVHSAQSPGLDSLQGTLSAVMKRVDAARGWIPILHPVTTTPPTQKAWDCHR